MQFGMPTLIECRTLEDNLALCRELGLSFVELAATPAVTLTVTPAVTPEPTIDVDVELLGKLYAETFSEENLTHVADGNDQHYFAARLELTEDEWDSVCRKLSADGRWCCQDSFCTADNPFARGNELFSPGESASFFEGWDQVEEAYIPDRETVHECIEAMQGSKDRIIVLYRVSVYGNE